jgi:poly(hydroxyalkanoate) depolymerase family esterase
VLPARDYLLYVPAGYDDTRARPLLVWIHGCRQGPEEFAAGTRVARLADEQGLLVLLPRQSQAANVERCWNWFDPLTAHGSGETAILAAQIEQVLREYRAEPGRIYVAGLSSGAALAATLALRAPHLVAAVALHSGMPCGAARSAAGARRAMRSGPETDTDAVALAARAERSPGGTLPALVIHGSADASVAPANAARLVRQFLLFNGAPTSRLPGQAGLPEPARRSRLANGTLPHEVSDFVVEGRLAVRLVSVESLGHAWSGGEPELAYFDPRGPDATRFTWEFFAQAGESRRLAQG